MTTQVKCKSGVTGWQGRLQDQYECYEEFKHYSELFNFHQRLGYETPAIAWRANPMVQGSVNPSDFRRVKA